MLHRIVTMWRKINLWEEEVVNNKEDANEDKQYTLPFDWGG